MRAVTILKSEMKKKLKEGFVLNKSLVIEKINQRIDSNTLYRYAYLLSENGLFQALIVLIIILNAAMMSLDFYPENTAITYYTDKLNFAFTIFFIFEMLTKLLGLGFKDYFADGYNIFDCLIVLASMSEIFFSEFSSYESRGTITAFRAFRMIRIFKLAKKWTQLNNLIQTIKETLKDVSTFTVLLAIIMLVFALMGRELFAY